MNFISTVKNKSINIGLKKAVYLFVFLMTVALLGGCINQTKAENLMEKELDSRFGKGNYTISNVYKSKPSEYSLSYTSVWATVTLNTGEQFNCVVYNYGGYSYNDEYTSIEFESEFNRIFNECSENIDGVELESIHLPDFSSSKSYDKTQLYEFMKDEGNLYICATYRISDSFSPEEALEAAKKIVEYYESIGFPYLNIYFRYGDFMHLYEYGRSEPRNFGMYYDSTAFDEELILKRFKEEADKDEKLKEILDKRYGEGNWELRYFGCEVFPYFDVYLLVEDQEVKGRYEDGRYEDSYVEAFMNEELKEILREPQNWQNGVEYRDSGALEFEYTEDTYAGEPERFLQNHDAYEYTPLIKIDESRYTVEQAAVIVCQIDDFYRKNNYKADCEYEYDKFRFEISYEPLTGDDAKDYHYIGSHADYDEIVDYINGRYGK